MAAPARRELGIALALCAAGAALALAACTRTWAHVLVPRSRPLADAAVEVAGRTLAPVAPALALVGLAGLVGLPATRRWGRPVVGAVLALAGLGLLIASLAHLGAPSPAAAESLLNGPLAGRDPSRSVQASAVAFWPAVSGLAGLLIAAGGTLTLLRWRSWPGLSGRYDAPARKKVPAATNAALWDSLDRGEDPT